MQKQNLTATVTADSQSLCTPQTDHDWQLARVCRESDAQGRSFAVITYRCEVCREERSDRRPIHMR